MKYLSRQNDHSTKLDQSGFTIVELMVATTVFAIILILLTFAIVGITHSYYKGVVASETQTAARNVLNNVTQAIQFAGTTEQSGTETSTNTSWVCFLPDQFTFELGYELVSGTPNTMLDQTNKALLYSHQAASCPVVGDTPTEDITNEVGSELLSPNMRLSELTVTPLSSALYQVTVKVTYGDNDQLNNPTLSTASCKEIVGSAFCSTATLSAVVQDRYNTGS